MVEVDVAADVGDQLGEGPVWDPSHDLLWWVDIEGSRLHQMEPGSGAVSTWELAQTPGAVAPRAGGGLVRAVGGGLAFFDPETAALDLIAAPEPERTGNRFNDGGCDPRGRFWAGSMDRSQQERTGALYRFEADGSWERMLDGLGIPNTVVWSADTTTFYFAETLDRVIHAYDFDPDRGVIANRRPFATTEPPGFPDGSAMDAEGCLWNAEYNGGRLVRHRPDGSPDRAIDLPVRRPTSCAFAGPGLDLLFVTTAAETAPHRVATAGPAGSLLVVDPGVPGLPRPPFAG